MHVSSVRAFATCCPLAWQAIADFDARAYGMDYIGLGREDTVVLLQPSTGDAADVQWTYGQVWGITKMVPRGVCRAELV